MKLNLGCGNDYRKGYINIDASKYAKPDVLLNIDGNKLPFPDNSVDEIVARAILEHVRDFEGLLKELYRVCKKGAKIIIDVPYFSSESAFSHYQHVTFFSWTTFDLFNPNHSQHFHTGIKFKITERHLEDRLLGKKVYLIYFQEFIKNFYLGYFLLEVYILSWRF